MFLFGWWFLWSLDWVHNFCLFFGFCGLLEVLYAVTFQFELWMKLIAWYLSSWERRGLVFLNCMDDTQHIQPNASMFPHRLECLMDDSFWETTFLSKSWLDTAKRFSCFTLTSNRSLVNRQDTQMRHIKNGYESNKSINWLFIFNDWISAVWLSMQSVSLSTFFAAQITKTISI